MKNIYLFLVIFIAFVALSILIGFLIDYYVIHKHFVKILEKANNNSDEILRNLFKSTKNFSCVYFILIYLLLVMQVVIIVIINHYYVNIREIRGPRGIRGPKGNSGTKGISQYGI